MGEVVRLLKDNPAVATPESIQALEDAVSELGEGNREISGRLDRLVRKQRK